MYYIILYYIILHFITLYYILLHFITLYYIIFYFITLYYILLHFITLYYIILHYITFYYCSCNGILQESFNYFLTMIQFNFLFYNCFYLINSFLKDKLIFVNFKTMSTI